MSPQSPGLPRRERAVAVIVSLVPFALSIGTFATDWRVFAGSVAIAGYVLIAAAAGFSLLNLHLSVLRLPLHRWRTGSSDGFRFVSGAPLLGDLMALGLWLVPPSNALAVGALLTMAINPNSMLWFAVVIARE